MYTLYQFAYFYLAVVPGYGPKIKVHTKHMYIRRYIYCFQLTFEEIMSGIATVMTSDHHWVPTVQLNSNLTLARVSLAGTQLVSK